MTPSYHFSQLLCMHNVFLFVCITDREGKTGANRFDDEAKRGWIKNTSWGPFNLCLYILFSAYRTV